MVRKNTNNNNDPKLLNEKEIVEGYELWGDQKWDMRIFGIGSMEWS